MVHRPKLKITVPQMKASLGGGFEEESFTVTVPKGNK
jgi:hypothetical protein